MDTARIEAILSGVPVAGRRRLAPKPTIKPDPNMSTCLAALSKLFARPSTGHRRLELTSSQLPPIF